MEAHTTYGSNRREGCQRGFGTNYHKNSCKFAYRNSLGGNALVVAGYGANENFGVDYINGSDPHNREPTWRLREHWIAVSRLPVTQWNYNMGGKKYGMYYMYAAVKGLRSFVPEVNLLANFETNNPAGPAMWCEKNGGPDHDTCDLLTAGYDQNGNLNGGCGQDPDCKSGHVCRSGQCKVVLQEGICLNAKYKNVGDPHGDNGSSDNRF